MDILAIIGSILLAVSVTAATVDYMIQEGQ